MKVCGLNAEHAQVGWGTQAFCLLTMKVSQWHKSLEFVVFHFFFFLSLDVSHGHLKFSLL